MTPVRIHWHDGPSEDAAGGGLARADEANVGGWDGYYANVATEAGVETVATIDDDFERFDAFDTELVLSTDEFAELDRFLGA